MKETLAEQQFTEQVDFLDVILAFLKESQTVELKHVFHHLIERVR
jgi:hypothetical protein